MPRIPDDYLGKKIAKAKEVITNKNVLLTTIMALIIFIVSAIEIVSFYLPDYVDPKLYKSFYYPLFCTLELFVLALFFVFKSFRYTSCTDTKVISILFALIQLISLAALIFQFKPGNYLLIAQPIITIGILVIILTNGIKWFLKQQ